MAKMLEEHDWGNSQKSAKKGCIPFYYYPKGSILEMVFSPRNITTGEEEVVRATTRGQEEERDYEGEIYKKQETSKPYTYFS